MLGTEIEVPLLEVRAACDDTQQPLDRALQSPVLGLRGISFLDSAYTSTYAVRRAAPLQSWMPLGSSAPCATAPWAPLALLPLAFPGPPSAAGSATLLLAPHTCRLTLRLPRIALSAA